MYPRNSASPPRLAIGPVVQISDGAVQTAGVSVKVIPQGGTEASGAGTVAYSADGAVLYTPTQAETDYVAVVFVASKTGCIPATLTVVMSASNTPGYAGLDWSKVGNATSTVALTGTTISTSQAVASVSGAVGSVAGRVTANTDQWGGVAVTGMPLPTSSYTPPDNATVSAISSNLVTVNNNVLTRLPISAYTTPPTAAQITTAVYAALPADHTVSGSYGARLLLALNTAREVKVTGTGSGHVAADIHACQQDVITAAALATDAVQEIQSGLATLANQTTIIGYLDTEVASIKSVTDKLNTGLVADGAVWQYTANMLELAPGGGGGGSGDASQANQVLILQSLNDIKGAGFTSSDDLVHLHDSINAAINSILTQSTPAVGSIVGFPATLHIGDSYTAATGNAIVVYLRDADNNPILGMGSKLFSAPDFRPSLVVSQANNVGRVEAVVSYQTPGGGAEPYLRVEIPSHQSRRGYAGMATMQCTLRWDGYQVTLATQPVEWIPQI